MAIWDKSVLGFSSTFIRKPAIPHSLPEVPKMITVENQNLLLDGLVPQFGHLEFQGARGFKMWAFTWEQGHTGQTTIWGASQFFKPWTLGDLFLYHFPPLSLKKELSELRLKPLSLSYGELVADTKNQVHHPLSGFVRATWKLTQRNESLLNTYESDLVWGTVHNFHSFSEVAAEPFHTWYDPSSHTGHRLRRTVFCCHHHNFLTVFWQSPAPTIFTSCCRFLTG